MAKSDVLVRWKADTQNYDANLAKSKRMMEDFTKSNLTAGGVVKQLTSSLISATAGFASITAAVGAFTSAIKSNIETARGFEKSMSQLSSLTGMVGNDLNQLKEYAIELGSTTTLSASQVADAFKMIGSQQPQLLSSGEALKQVTEYAIRLSEAAGIDLSTAAQTLSTSINQMGGDSNNAERYINVLAAASQKGAGDIAWLGEAITKSAAIAKAAGTDYEELVANLEQLAKAGFDASTSGTALRSIIMNLEKQSNQDFKPSVVGLTQAFENLGKAQLDIAGYQGIVGKMFAAQAMALANAAGEARQMTEDITGTNTAMSQAQTNVENLDGALKSLSSAWEGLNLHINDSNGLLKDGVEGLTTTVRLVDKLYTSVSNTSGVFSGFGKALQDAILGPIKKLNLELITLNVIFTKVFGKSNKFVGTSENSAVGMMGGNPVLNSYATQYGDYGIAPSVQAPTPTPTTTTTTTTTTTGTSLSDLKAKLKELRKLRDEAIDEGNMELRDDLNAQIKALEDQIRALKGISKTNTKGKASEGSIAAQEELVQELTKKWKEATDQVGRDGYLKQLDEAKKKLEQMTNGDDIEKLFPQRDTTQSTGTSSFDSLQSQIREELASKNMLVDEMTLHSLMSTALQNGIDSLDPDFTTLKEKMAEGMDIPDETWQGLQDTINAKLKELGIEPIKLDFKTGEVKAQAADMVKSWQAAGSAIQSVGQAMSAIEDPAAKVVGTVAQAVATMALSYAEASVNAAKNPAMAGWGWIAFAATGLATMLTSISAIKNASHFAQGGIVPGNDYSDNKPVLVSSGELILNKSQQNTLATELTRGSDGGGVYGTPYVSGEQIFLGLNNYLHRTGRGELVTAH